MNPFKILQIRKMIKEGREDPSQFAGQQVHGLLWGMLIVPIIFYSLVLGLFFIMGYTHLFGFSLGFFRFLFWLFLIPSIVVFSALRKMFRGASRSMTQQTKKVLEAVATEVEDEERV